MVLKMTFASRYHWDHGWRRGKCPNLAATLPTRGNAPKTRRDESTCCSHILITIIHARVPRRSYLDLPLIVRLSYVVSIPQDTAYSPIIFSSRVAQDLYFDSKY